MTQESYIEGLAHNYWKTLVWGCSLDCFSDYYGSLPNLGNHDDLAVNQALLNLSNQKTDFGQNFVEHQQVADMTAGTVTDIAHSVKDYKRRNPRDWSKVKKLTSFGRKKLGAIPNSWLELQYGWIPLLLDVKGAFDVMKQVDSDSVSMRYSVHGHSGESSSYLTSSQYFGASSSFHFGKMRYQIEDRVGCTVRLDFYMDNPMLHEAQQIGLVNPVQLAWNLVPYSFVADWFLPVGDYLQSWTAPLGLSFLAGSVSTLRKRRVTEGIFVPDPIMDYATVSGGYADNVSFSRIILSDFPGPRMPHFKNPLSLHHLANAMSLLVNVLR